VTNGPRTATEVDTPAGGVPPSWPAAASTLLAAARASRCSSCTRPAEPGPGSSSTGCWRAGFDVVRARSPPGFGGFGQLIGLFAIGPSTHEQVTRSAELFAVRGDPRPAAARRRPGRGGSCPGGVNRRRAGDRRAGRPGNLRVAETAPAGPLHEVGRGTDRGPAMPGMTRVTSVNGLPVSSRPGRQAGRAAGNSPGSPAPCRRPAAPTRPRAGRPRTRSA